ncbi:MAG: hypothetical protein IK061_10145, partial [Desulfovibrio sp.]|nr:hypothetical protein [Desulfovibrio sp.]
MQKLYDILQGLGVSAQKTLSDRNLWPKNAGADDFTKLGVFLCDYLMDRNPDHRFALLHPDLRADLESENASRSGQTDAQGFIRVGFYSGFVGVSTTRQAENEKELENLVKNANGQFRKVLGERLHIPQIYLSKAKPAGLEARAKQLADDIRTGRLPLPGEEAVFSNEAAFMTLMEQAVQVYAEAYLRVDEQGGLSEQAAAQMKDFLLTLSLPLPGGLSVADIFTVAGQTDARTFLSMLTVDNPVGAVASSWAGLVDGISRACADRIGAQQWAALSQEEKANVLSLAWMAVQAAVPGLREALADKGPGLLAGVEGSLGASNANPLIKEHFPLMRAIVNNAAGNAKSDNDRLANSLGEKANLGDMSPMNAQMLDQGILHLRERFGRQCLPDERQIVLDLRLPENGGKTLRNVLQERIRAADHGVTPRELANMTAELLLPVAQAQVAANRLRELALADGIGALHPETLAFALNTLRAVYPQMETFATLENAEGILSMLAAIPQEEVLAILRDARVMQDYSDLAMAQALSEAAGLIPGYALRLLAMNGRNMESAFGEGYRAMLSEASAKPNARLAGQALAEWCQDQAGKAIAPWADAINAIKASSLPAESKKVLLRRALLEADPSVLTKALAVAQKLDVRGIKEALALNATLDDAGLIGLLANLAHQMNTAVSEAANGLPPEDAQRLLSETRQMLLALHPDLAEKLAQPANRLEPLSLLAVQARDNGLGGLALIHAARGREASLWQMPDEDVKAIRDGSATSAQQKKLDDLLNRGRALLKREQTRLNMPPDKLPYLRNLIGAVLQDPYVDADAQEPLIMQRAEYLLAWEDVAP